MMVWVDAACNINYASFYIVGLRRLFGRGNVRFCDRPFAGLRYDTETHILAFVVDGRRYVIDFADSNKVFFESFVKWADCYGKVNYRKECLPSAYQGKIIPVGANFGMACYGNDRYSAVFWSLWHYALIHKRLNYGFGAYLSPYLWVYKRPEFKLSPLSDSGSIFFVARYWRGQQHVNDARIAFIRACRRLDTEGVVSFRGGLVPDSKNCDVPEDVIFEKEIPFGEYVRLAERSMLVFNTPSYHKCHGWRLPEYLCQGKVILSTPWENELPVPLRHGENIYFTAADEDAIYEAVKELAGSRGLRTRLSDGARDYWNEWADPAACLRKFFTDANKMI